MEKNGVHCEFIVKIMYMFCEEDMFPDLVVLFMQTCNIDLQLNNLYCLVMDISCLDIWLLCYGDSRVMIVFSVQL